MNTKHQTPGIGKISTIISLAISIALLSSLVQPIFANGGQASRERNREAAEEAATTQSRTTENDVITTDGSGVFAAENSQRRIEFSRNGIRCLPKLEQSEDAEFDYHLTSMIAQGDDQVTEETLRSVRPKRNGNEIYYFRSDGLLEKYRSTEDGVEQTFVLQQAPAAVDQDVLLRGQVNTGLRAEAFNLRTLSGVTYLMGRQPVVLYESPVVTDAAGRETTTELRIEGDQLDLVIEASFLRKAEYPVTLSASIRTNSRGAGARPSDSMNTAAVASIEDSGVWRVQLRVQTADVSNAGTDDFVGVKLNSSNTTWMDYGRDDFERNDAFTYDLVLDNVDRLSDIAYLHLFKGGNNGWCVRSVVLYVNGIAIFTRDFGLAGRWLDNDGYDHRSITIPSTSLRSSSSWSSYASPNPPLLFSRSELQSRIETTVAQFLATCSANWGQYHGRAVEVTRLDGRTISADLDLVGGYGQEIDVDFSMTFSCASGRLFLAVSPTNCGVFGPNPSDALLQMQFIDYLIQLGERIEASLHNFTYTRYGVPACPAINVLSDGSVSIAV